MEADHKHDSILLTISQQYKALASQRQQSGIRTLAERGIEACIPTKSNRKIAIPHDPALYRQRHKIEIMFGRLKDWRRIHTRYDRCADAFFSAICIAATVIFWLGQ